VRVINNSFTARHTNDTHRSDHCTPPDRPGSEDAYAVAEKQLDGKSDDRAHDGGAVRNSLDMCDENTEQGAH
jgi:hypothetical protein